MGKNIDQITRTLTTLTGAERMAVRDDSGDAKAVIETALLDYITSGVLDTYVKNYIESGAVDNYMKNYIESGAVDNYVKAKSEPIGTVKDWDKTLSGTPALDATWRECDGSMIDDTDSPYDGQRIRNLNGADVILTGIVWALGVATIPSADLPALAVGDYVAGSGIDSEAYITDITGTTVTMSDTSFTGTVTTTFSNDGRFVRGGKTSGDGQKDQMQLLEGNFALRPYPLINGSTSGAFSASPGTSCGEISGTATASPRKVVKFSSANSPDARTSATTAGETRPTNTTMVKIIKIKDTL